MKPQIVKIYNQKSIILQTQSIEAALSLQGGHLAPVRFVFGSEGKTAEPYRVAPWWNEKLPPDTPGVLSVLRGDFFCMPFGGNGKPWRGEKHPPHGETSEKRWECETLHRTSEGIRARFALDISVRPGRVTKEIVLLENQTCIYSRHRIAGMSGPMCLGHHPTLAFPDRPGSGLISTAPFRLGQVYPRPFENPGEKGYSILKPGALFSDLQKVERADGQFADLSRYPIHRGFEDLVIMCAEPDIFPGWSAVTFPQEGWLWFSLKDPAVLASTVLWLDNGGRHYAPWNGRSVNTLGVEEVTAYFHEGLAPSAGMNPLRRQGIPTSITLSIRQPLSVGFIQGVAKIPRGFGRVREAIPECSGAIRFEDESRRRVRVRVHWPFLRGERTGIALLDEPVE